MSDFWDQAKGVLGFVAPTLGAALGGPLGGMAGKLIANVLLGTDTANDKQVAAAIANMSPEQAVQLKQAELQFQAHMKELDIEVDRIDAGDRDSARKREIEVRDRMPGVLAILVTVGFFTLLAWMSFSPLPASNEQALGIMLGSLGTAWVGCMAYYFGSSAGSRAKDATISALGAK